MMKYIRISLCIYFQKKKKKKIQKTRNKFILIPEQSQILQGFHYLTSVEEFRKVLRNYVLSHTENNYIFIDVVGGK